MDRDKKWEYQQQSVSQYLGTAQRLPHGNYCIVHSMSGAIYEVNRSGDLIQSFDNSYSFAEGLGDYSLLGYASFRPTLYGPPTTTWPE